MDLIESDHWLFWPKVTVQVNLCQKHLFFNQLTHNMTTDCSLIPDFSAKKIQVQDMLCTKIVLNAKTKTKNQFLYTTCSEHVFFLYWSRKSMNNLLSYCGLNDSRMSASEKDLPVHKHQISTLKTVSKSLNDVLLTEKLLLATLQ